MKLFSLIFRLIYKKIFYRRCIKIKISEKEFEKLFDKYKNDIYRLAYTYVNNQADALDIVQETAYQAYTSKDKIRDVEIRLKDENGSFYTPSSWYASGGGDFWTGNYHFEKMVK